MIHRTWISLLLLFLAVFATAKYIRQNMYPIPTLPYDQSSGWQAIDSIAMSYHMLLFRIADNKIPSELNYTNAFGCYRAHYFYISHVNQPTKAFVSLKKTLMMEGLKYKDMLFKANGNCSQHARLFFSITNRLAIRRNPDSFYD